MLSKRRVETNGRVVTGICAGIATLLVIMLIFMVAQHGLATFVVDGISPVNFSRGRRGTPFQR